VPAFWKAFWKVFIVSDYCHDGEVKHVVQHDDPVGCYQESIYDI